MVVNLEIVKSYCFDKRPFLPYHATFKRRIKKKKIHRICGARHAKKNYILFLNFLEQHFKILNFVRERKYNIKRCGWF